MNASRFAAAYAALTAAHEVGDHWAQTDAQAVAKGTSGSEGAQACARHVATYTATQAVALVFTAKVTGMKLHTGRALSALALSALTHYVADRSAGHWKDTDPTGVPALAHITGSGGWLQRDPNAAYLLDQSWHKGWIFLAALVASSGKR